MSLVDRLLKRVPGTPAAPRLQMARSAGGVQRSADLNRVRLLPWRERPSPEALARLQELWTTRLGKRNPDGSAPVCGCEKVFKRACCRRLLPIQAWALEEISRTGGLFGPISVGDGKSLLDLLAPFALPGCKKAVLFVQPNLKAQLLKVDWAYYGQHYNLPNLAGQTTGGGEGRWFIEGRPALHVYSFNELSNVKAMKLLLDLQPDSLIVDEGQNLARPEATRTKRFLEFFKQFPAARLCVWSGTLTDRSLRDYAHLSRLSLKAGSPHPADDHVIDEWCSALDPSMSPTGAGALLELVPPGRPPAVDAREAVRRRTEATVGVVSSPPVDTCKASLVVRARDVPACPDLEDALHRVQHLWERPDGEPLVQILDVVRCQEQLCCGFFYRWVFPRQEPEAVRTRWWAARRAWFAEIRERLKHARTGMDSPLLCTQAAIRWHKGYWHVSRDEAGKKTGRVWYPPKTKMGPQLTWAAEHWPEWAAVKGLVVKRTETVWVSEAVLQDAEAWMKAGVGVVWVDHRAFAEELHRRTRAPLYLGGQKASAAIVLEHGSRTIIASQNAHGTGKNLQAFNRALVVCFPASGKAAEQLLGRHHRQGQLADEVEFEVYQHTSHLRDALNKARELARYISETFGGSQKLLRATVVPLESGRVRAKPK